MTATKAEAFMNFSWDYFLRELGFPVFAALGFAQPAPRLTGLEGFSSAFLLFTGLAFLPSGRLPFAPFFPSFSSFFPPARCAP